MYLLVLVMSRAVFFTEVCLTSRLVKVVFYLRTVRYFWCKAWSFVAWSITHRLVHWQRGLTARAEQEIVNPCISFNAQVHRFGEIEINCKGNLVKLVAGWYHEYASGFLFTFSVCCGYVCYTNKLPFVIRITCRLLCFHANTKRRWNAHSTHAQ